MTLVSYRSRLRPRAEHIADEWDFQPPNKHTTSAVVTNRVVERYSPEDALLDALEELPTPSQVRRLIELLRHKELKEVAEGILNDCSEAAKTLQPSEYANAVNSWMATAEEIIANRRTYRYIMASKERGNPRREKP